MPDNRNTQSGTAPKKTLLEHIWEEISEIPEELHENLHESLVRLGFIKPIDHVAPVPEEQPVGQTSEVHQEGNQELNEKAPGDPVAPLTAGEEGTGAAPQAPSTQPPQEEGQPVS